MAEELNEDAPGRFAVDTSRSDLYLVSVTGSLDAGAATRLLRLVDARLQAVELGHGCTRHIVVDLSRVSTVTATGLAILAHAPYAASHRGVGFCLAGVGALAATVPLTARKHLHRFVSYPSVAAARTALGQSTDRREGSDRVGPACSGPHSGEGALEPTAPAADPGSRVED
jgi:anti-anti-sigma regulatory factor